MQEEEYTDDMSEQQADESGINDTEQTETAKQTKGEKNFAKLLNERNSARKEAEELRSKLEELNKKSNPTELDKIEIEAFFEGNPDAKAYEKRISMLKKQHPTMSVQNLYILAKNENKQGGEEVTTSGVSYTPNNDYSKMSSSELTDLYRKEIESGRLR